MNFFASLVALCLVASFAPVSYAQYLAAEGHKTSEQQEAEKRNISFAKFKASNDSIKSARLEWEKTHPEEVKAAAEATAAAKKRELLAYEKANTPQMKMEARKYILNKMCECENTLFKKQMTRLHAFNTPQGLAAVKTTMRAAEIALCSTAQDKADEEQNRECINKFNQSLYKHKYTGTVVGEDLYYSNEFQAYKKEKNNQRMALQNTCYNYVKEQARTRNWKPR